MRARRDLSFTLVELLVVVSIIGLLLAVLVPVLSGARHQTRGVVCASNLRQLMSGMTLYSTEYGALPGTHSLFYFQSLFSTVWPRPAGVTWDGARDKLVDLTITPAYTKPHHLDPDFIADVPRKGTLFSYVGDERAYLCPADKPGEADASPIGGGGNGRLSYSLNAYIGYRSPESLGGFTYVADALDGPLPDGGTRSFRAGQQVNIPASRFMTLFEEHPNFHMNTSFPEGNFNCIDRLATRHMPTADANGKNPAGRATIAFLDGHAENPVYPALTEGRQLFTEFGQPHYWRRTGPQDKANMSAFIKDIPGICPWGPP